MSIIWQGDRFTEPEGTKLIISGTAILQALESLVHFIRQHLILLTAGSGFLHFAVNYIFRGSLSAFPRVYASDATWFDRLTNPLRFFKQARKIAFLDAKLVSHLIDRIDKVSQYLLPHSTAWTSRVRRSGPRPRQGNLHCQLNRNGVGTPGTIREPLPNENSHG